MTTLLRLCNLFAMVFNGIMVGWLAITIIAVFVSLGPQAMQVIYGPAKLFQHGDYAAAGEGFAGIRRATGGSPWLLGNEPEMAALCFLLSGEARQAEESVRSAYRESPQPVECLRWEARAVAARGALLDAAGIMAHAARENPSDPTLVGEAAEMYYAAGEKAKARAYLDRSRIAAMTWNPVPWLVRAKFAALEGKWAEADREIAAALRRTVTMGPGAAETYRLAGALAHRAKPGSGGNLLNLSYSNVYQVAAQMRAAIYPDALLTVWEADAPALRAAYQSAGNHHGYLAPWNGRPNRLVAARAAISKSRTEVH